ncbi:Flp pilus assembly protein TadG [Pseudomonas benzenivorans]|nr:TadE/TadG family type IV pilus assembly protein [Pseudomonas benzenivorans]SDH86236.1 Flp pilus assembly protein TadG [Pseudomonas benzenivorans]
MNPCTQRPFTATPGRQRGAVMVLIVIALASLLLMGALALDGGHMLLNKTRLQNAVDAAALSGAKTLQQVTGSGNASTVTRDAALNTLSLNASASGNGELSTGIAGSGGVGAFAIVELSNSVYGPFSFPGPVDASYVRVTVPDYSLAGFFWNLAQSFSAGNLGDKAVAAIATAGPSPSAMPCRIEPILVCGDPDQYDPASGNFWGYGFGELKVLKSAAGDEAEIGPGNFQLLRLDGATGANDLRDDLAGGIDKCNVVGEEAETEPGNTVGPVAQGLNTRLGEYAGGMSANDYPPDWVTDFTSPRVTYNDSTAPPQVEYEGEVVTSSDGNLSTSSAELFDYNDWLEASTACAASGTCSGAYERRILTLVIGNCDGASGGQTSVPVLGFGCFYLMQTVKQSGVEAQVFGQFISECEGDGYAGATPADDVGPNIIQLYKTYFSGVSTPSPDS